MKKINRFVNFFQYGSNPHKDFEVKAFNERGRHVKILVTELTSLSKPYNYYILQTQKPTGNPDYLVFEREGAQTELFFSISDIDDGNYTCTVFGSDNTTYQQGKDTPLDDITFTLGSDTDFQQVQLGRAGFEQTGDEIFWDAIKERQLNFNGYFNFVNKILYLSTTDFNDNKRKSIVNQGPFVGVREYNLLKYGTAFYMLKKSALNINEVKSYLGSDNILPYYENLSDAYDEALKEYPVVKRNNPNEDQKLVIERFENPFFIELIWSYWMEQGMLMQGMSLINFRFQNVNAGNLGQIGRFDLNPLRGLSHILWGFIQDEQHRLSLPRRVQEYDHEYGLVLNGKSAAPFLAADTRSKFVEAFHNLLTKTSIFYKEADDTTRIADAFPILNSLKEVHLLLAEGNHNAYGNLTWTARHEMMMTQYILARDEVRQFLGGRPMVPYPERWMDRMDTIRSIMNWGNTSITYFYDLAIHGEKILLAIRYGNWSDAHMPVSSAANWAMSFRDSIQKYIHAYRTVTAVDLSADAMGANGSRNIQPSVLIQRRVLEERSRVRRA